MNIYEPSQIRGEATGPSTEISHITTEDGIRVHLKGHPHYICGFPTFEAVHAINIVKKCLLLQPLAAARAALAPYTMQVHLMCPPARAIRSTFPGTLGLIVSHVIEYDSAYRARLHGAIMAVSSYDLQHAPIRSILACIKRNRQNDYLAAHKKIRAAGAALILCLCWPPFRTRFRRLDFKALYPDEADLYWLRQRTDYGTLNQNKI